MKNKVALITGITGQDGAYLAEFLLSKGYEVHGIKRRSSSFNTSRLDNLYQDPHSKDVKFHLHYGDMTDATNLIGLMQKINPDEVYNLAAQSHVQVSFETPEYTANADGIGALRLLEAIRLLNMTKTVKFYQASTSELYGNSNIIPQDENTPFSPRSPYAAAKLYAYWITVNYRLAYNIFACNGILFNHESPFRGDNFVTKKIINSLTKIKYGKQKQLILGNLYSKRDWGHAADYVEAIHKILQQKKPDDYVIATGKQFTIKEFVQKVAKNLQLKLHWSGKGLKECALDKEGKVIIKISKIYFRPLEVNFLKGNAAKARRTLKWKPKINLDQLINEMI